MNWTVSKEQRSESRLGVNASRCSLFSANCSMLYCLQVMSLRSFANWKSLLVVGCVVFFTTVGITQFATPTFALGINEPCETDSQCNTGDTCSTPGACVCRELGGLIEGRCGETLATDVTQAVEGTALEGVVGSALGSSDACGTSDNVALGIICQGFIFILSVIVELLGKLVLLILTILMAFAKYNSFASAAPVEVGWPIVRDICNMFFIVVLLISAFSTIIDYGGGEFHYTKVLPRLLLMAVLINFSKTLIQLLIDFSQVVMLTFVNAFASAAQGNFVNALGLTQIMQLSENAPAGTATGSSLIISYMLAIFMLGIMISVVTIMTAFLIFRIVGLWIALIMSPLAFFVTAIPSKLSKNLGSIGSDYWSRLGSLLTGGPIIAFFLWLTLAIVQQANSGSAGQGLSQVLDFQVEGDVQAYLTSIGNAQSIASFIVGITLLMMGLDQAVKSAGAIGGTVGASFAARAKGAGLSLGRLGATLPFLAAGYAARGGARAIDKRVDLTGRVSGAALRGYQGMVPRSLQSDTVVGGLRRGQLMRRKEAAAEGTSSAKEEKDYLESVKKFGRAPKEIAGAFGAAEARRASPSLMRTLGAKEGDAQLMNYLAEEKRKQVSAKANKNAYKDQINAAAKKSGAFITDDEAKAGSNVLAMKAAQGQQTAAYEKELALADAAKNPDRLLAIQNQALVNPLLRKQGPERDEALKKWSNEDGAWKDTPDHVALNGEAMTAALLDHGYKVQKDPTTGKETMEVDDQQKVKRYLDRVGTKSKTMKEGLEAHMALIRESPGESADFFKNVQHKKNDADKKMQAFNYSDGDKQGLRVRNGNQEAAFTAIRTADTGKSKGSYTLDPVQASKYMNAGGSLPELIKTSGNADKPMETVATNVMRPSIDGAVAAIASKDFAEATKQLKSAIPIMTDLDQDGVGREHSAPFIEEFAVSGGGTIIEQLDKIQKEDRPATLTTLKVAVDYNNEINRQVAQTGVAATTRQKAVQKMVEDLVEKSKAKGFNAAGRAILREGSVGGGGGTPTP